MKRSHSKIISVLVLFVMIASVIPISSITASAIIESGTCGDNLTWTCDTATQTLTISGTGEMDDFNHNRGPWDSCSDDIKYVVIEDDVTTIGDVAFVDCLNLTDVTIGNSVTTLGESSFSNCDKLISVNIPNSVTTISDYAFDDCDKLVNITIGNNVTSIGSYAFSRCDSLTSILIPNNVTTIDGYAFAHCTNLTSVQISDSITTISYGLFESCINLMSLTGGNNVTTIKENAFHDCDGITSIIIPNSVKVIETDAFGDCDNITDVHFNGTEKEWNKIAIGDDNKPLLNATIHFSCYRHDYNSNVTPPTCTEQGYTIYTCECGDTYIDDYISATGHNYKIEVTAPTSAEAGYTTYTCYDCGHGYKDNYIPALGKVNGVSISDTTLIYKTADTIKPEINIDAGVNYITEYTSSNPSVVVVDKNGNITSIGGTGEVIITITVTDEYGNVVEDNCKVTVSYKWWQWLIIIFLFGWIWY